jgi:uncharacterized protein YybS (DUF2232 family)
MFVACITSKAIGNRLKREGIIISGESSREELIHRLLPTLVPVFNIILALIFVFCADEMYKKLKKEFDTKGR